MKKKIPSKQRFATVASPLMINSFLRETSELHAANICKNDGTAPVCLIWSLTVPLKIILITILQIEKIKLK